MKYFFGSCRILSKNGQKQERNFLILAQKRKLLPRNAYNLLVIIRIEVFEGRLQETSRVGDCLQNPALAGKNGESRNQYWSRLSVMCVKWETFPTSENRRTCSYVEPRKRLLQSKKRINVTWQVPTYSGRERQWRLPSSVLQRPCPPPCGRRSTSLPHLLRRLACRLHA